MTLIPRPAGPAGEPARRRGATWMAGVLAGLAAVRPAGPGPQPAPAPRPASPAGGAGR